MRYVEAPNELVPSAVPSVFLGGGITGCPDWQAEIVRSMTDDNVVLLNPRRKDFPIHDPNAARAQITWEHEHLRKANAVLFWFPKDTLCPIVLYELGAWSMTNKPIFVGVEPGYQRTQDVIIQTTLVRPEIRVVASLPKLEEQVRSWLRGYDRRG